MNAEEKIQRLREIYQLAEANGDQRAMDRARTGLYDILRKQEIRKNIGPGEAVAAGVANKAASLVEGGVMALGKAGAAASGEPSPSVEWAEEERQKRQEAVAPLAEARPFAYGAGEIMPSMAIPGGAAPGFFKRAAGAAAAAGGERFVESGGDVDEALIAGGLGAAGNELGRLMSRAVVGRPTPQSARTPAHKAELERAERLGYEFTPATTVGDPHLEQVEAALGRDPLTSGPFIEIGQKNQNKANEIARRSVGLEGADKLTDDVLDERHATLGASFEKIVGGDKSFPITDDYYTGLEAVRDSVQEGLTSAPKKVKRVIDKLEERGKNQFMTVKEYQQLASDLAGLARSSKDPALTRALYKARDALDYEFEKEFGNLPGLREARQHWRALKDMERAKAISGGDFRPAVFYNYLRRGGKSVKPGPEINELAMAGHYGRNSVANSGTPTGASLQSVLSPSGITRAVLGNTVSRGYLKTNQPGSGPMAFYPLPEVSEMLLSRGGRTAAPGVLAPTE